MFKYQALVIICLFIWFSPNVSFAQETDPYEDYSHLWEDTGKKKKKNKKEKTVDTPPSTIKVPTDSIKLPVDSLKQETLKPDSLNNEIIEQQQTPIETFEQPAVRDTIPQPDPVPADTLKPDQTDADILSEEEAEIKEEKVKEKKEKKERKADDGPPVEDFRSGMGAMSGKSTMNGGFTYTRIGDQNFVGLTLNPELQIWKIGLGLNVPILFNMEDYSFRSEIFEDGVGAARLINYVRYGVQKRDPIYVKAGELNNTMIGYGGLVNNYTNSTSFEKRKLGMHYDLNFKGLVGIEGMYSDFDPVSTNLLVFRPYVRPLSFTGIPIVKTLEIGSVFLSDRDQTRRPISDSTYSTYNFTQNGIGAFGIDAGITLLRIPFIQIDAFANYSRMDIAKGGLIDSLGDINSTLYDTEFTDGKGFSYGVNFRFHFIADILSTDVRIERLNYSDNFIPQFFDASYELNKDAKIRMLRTARAQSGIYGSLTGHILQKVQLGGSLLLPDELEEGSAAVVQVNATLDRLMDKYSMQASYIKGNLLNLEDAFKLDERSIAKVRFIYHLNRFMAAGVDYFWAFTPTADGSYQATQYISPYFGLSIQF